LWLVDIAWSTEFVWVLLLLFSIWKKKSKNESIFTFSLVHLGNGFTFLFREDINTAYYQFICAYCFTVLTVRCQ
jgi:hypothetical protein